MKCIHVISALKSGGMENTVKNLSLMQKANGYDVRIVCIRELGQTADYLMSQGMPVDLVYFKSRIHPHSIMQLKKYFQKYQPDIIQTHNYRPNTSATIAAKLAGIPVLSTLHTVNRFDSWRQLMMDRFLSKMKDGIVCVSNIVRDEYIRVAKVSEDKMKVIYNGIDPKNVVLPQPEHAQVDALREKYGLNGCRIIGIAGRFVKIKNLEGAIDIYDQLQKKYTEPVKLIMLGTGPMEDRLKKKVKDLGLEDDIIFPGFCSDMKPWFQLFDILLLTSLVEGFSLTVVEAMMNRLPIVASEVGGNLEAVTNGKEGFLYPLDQPGIAVDSICKILQSKELHEQMGQAAFDKAMGSFTLEQQYKTTHTYYQEIVDKRSS